MNLLRLATGVMGMLAGIIMVGYTLGWMVRRVAQLLAGTVAIASGGLIFLVSVTSVLDELQENRDLEKTMKAARKRLRDQDLAKTMERAQKRMNRRELEKTMKSARQRRHQLQREASKLWR